MPSACEASGWADPDSPPPGSPLRGLPTSPLQGQVGGEACASAPSRAFHVAVDHALLAGLVEGHRELVAVDRDDVAVAEFEMEHALADRIGRGRAGRLRHELALDRHRPAPPVALAAPILRGGFLGPG